MKVLVTGGFGYLGSVLMPILLRASHEVRVIDNLMYSPAFGWQLAGQEGFEFIRGDLLDPSVVREAVRGMDAVVHLAAIVGDPACSRQPALARAVNLQASVALFEAAKSAGVRHFVFASTCSNYGRIADSSRPASEDFPLLPLSLYAETKVEVEQTLLNSPADSILTTILRFATLYGLSPRMRFDLTVNEFVLSLYRDRKLVVYGEKFWRPYVHVRDAARAVLAVLHAQPLLVSRKVFNVGDSRENYRKLDLADLIVARIGGGQVEYVHRAEDPRDYKVSFERIRSSLGFTTTRTVPGGVDEIVNAIEAGLVVDTPRAAHSNTPDDALVRT